MTRIQGSSRIRTKKISVNPLYPCHPRSIVGWVITNAGYGFPYKQMRTALEASEATSGTPDSDQYVFPHDCALEATRTQGARNDNRQVGNAPVSRSMLVPVDSPEN